MGQPTTQRTHSGASVKTKTTISMIYTIQTRRPDSNAPSLAPPHESTGGCESSPTASTSLWRVGISQILTGLLLLLVGARATHADRSPPGCTGSGLGISLFTSVPDVHIGDTIRYSINVFNAPFPACDATALRAFIVTPDGITNTIALRRTSLIPGEMDLYPDVVSYVVRAQDIRPDGTVRATAFDDGDIHQNDTNSRGGSNQGVNTEVNQPCVKLSALCVGGVGENGAITFTGWGKSGHSSRSRSW